MNVEEVSSRGHTEPQLTSHKLFWPQPDSQELIFFEKGCVCVCARACMCIDACAGGGQEKAGKKSKIGQRSLQVHKLKFIFYIL